MTTGVSFEILDLRHFKAPQLRPVLEAESILWRERLHWDYTASINLLMQYFDAHTLPGYVATIHGKIAGYAFFVYDEVKAVIGDLFAIPTPESDEALSHEIEQTLLRHLLETLLASPGVERIESQLLVLPSGLHIEQFRKAGFQIYPRLFLARTLQTPLSIYPEPSIKLAAPLDLRPWRDEDLHQAGDLIAVSYQDHLDSRVNDQYRTVHGSMRFLNNIIRYPGCGVFLPNVSQVIVERQSHNLVALILCSRISPESGHITQLCVHPEYRHHGLARLLLESVASKFALLGATQLTLTVTADNTDAVNLYRAEGYQIQHRFDATVWTKE